MLRFSLNGENGGVMRDLEVEKATENVSVSFDTPPVKALYSQDSSTWMDVSEVAHSHVTVNKNLAQWHK